MRHCARCSRVTEETGGTGPALLKKQKVIKEDGAFKWTIEAARAKCNMNLE